MSHLLENARSGCPDEQKVIDGSGRFLQLSGKRRQVLNAEHGRRGKIYGRVEIEELIGSAAKCQGCPGQALCKENSKEHPDQKTIDLRMKPIKHKVMILSGKGGVGKSTLSALLSCYAAQQHYKVGLLDLDICGPSIPQMMNLKNQHITSGPYGWLPLTSDCGVNIMSVGFLLSEEDSAVIWRGPRKTGMISRFLKETFWGKLDYLFFDTPPGTSDEHLTVVKCLKNTKPDGAIIITTSQDIALATIKKEVDFCKKMNVNILGVVENMSGFICPCCKESYNLFHDKMVEQFCIDNSLKFLGKLPLQTSIGDWCEGKAGSLDVNVSNQIEIIFRKINLN